MVDTQRRTRRGLLRGLLLYGPALLLLQMLLRQLQLFLRLLACLLLHFVGRGPPMPISMAGRRPSLPRFMLRGGYLLLLAMVRCGPLLM